MMGVVRAVDVRKLPSGATCVRRLLPGATDVRTLPPEEYPSGV